MSDGWPVATPAKEGIDPNLTCAIGPSLEKLEGAYPNGVVVVRYGALIYERYFVAGIEYGTDTLHEVRSITKSVVALLIGVALDHGWLRSLDDRVFSYFPEDADLVTPDKNRITLRNLLTMTSGLEWPESAVSYNNPLNVERRMGLTSDPYRFVLKQPLAETPGTAWNYNSGGVELLGGIMMKVSRQPLDEFAKQALFEPLGIRDWEWGRSPNGKLVAAAGLWLRPRDLAKIGQLVLNHGAWYGRQIVSAKWIKEMTAPQAPWWPGGGYAYGYLWWLGRLATRDRDIDWAAAEGWGGQRLYVVPSLDLVVTVTASNYGFGDPQYLSELDLAGYTALDMVLRAATPPPPTEGVLPTRPAAPTAKPSGKTNG
jgi:CubicO group peptidase (beta-lactamase class C family)